MKEMIDNKVANGVATKKKYVNPEIEVIDLDEQPKLLSASGPYGAGLHGIDDDEL